MRQSTLFSDFLTLLDVPHTGSYSDARFRAYPSKHTFIALQDLLAEYAVLSSLTDDASKDLTKLHEPFVARMADGFMIVTRIDAGNVYGMVRGSRAVSMPLNEFEGKWTGEALTASQMAMASEPDYRQHRAKCLTDRLMGIAFRIIALGLVAYFVIVNKTYEQWSHLVALLLTAAGVYVSYLLVLKESHVVSSAADALCGVIQKEGCAHVLASDGSALFGTIPWCEIGITYFSVTFLALLIFPMPLMPYLAVISVCCLPYTLWSVTYQKFKAKAWCTMCLTVQTIFWLLFATYLLGGDFRGLTPIRWSPIALLLCTYALTLITIHFLVPRIFHAERADAATPTTDSAVRPH